MSVISKISQIHLVTLNYVLTKSGSSSSDSPDKSSVRVILSTQPVRSPKLFSGTFT